MHEFTYEKWIVPQNIDTSSVKFGGGDGKSLASAYVISGPAQMTKLAEDVNNGTSYRGSCFRLENDIDFGGAEWVPIGYCAGPFDKREFGGIFDGGGHTVRNFKVENQGNKSAGLFGYIEYAVVQNLYVMDFEIKDGEAVGGIVGYAETSTVASCYAEGKIKSGASNAGGMVGLACNSRIENSASSVLVSAQGGNAAGGMCGFAYNGAKLTNCESRGELRAKNMGDAGGFVGSIKDSFVENCHSKSSVMSLDCGNVGGFGGMIRNCRLDWCTALSAVSAANQDTSALVGGFVGFTNSVMTRCIASGNVLKGGDGGSAGGFAGDVSRASIYSSYSRGSVSAEGAVGGFAGAASCNEGSTNIENCYSLGAVTSNEKKTQAGGFIGIMRRQGGNVVVTNCYSFGALSLNVRGFTTQQSTGGIVDCVWRRDASGINDEITDGRGIQELSTEQFGDRDFFAGMGWSIMDGESVWCYSEGITPGRPHLNGLPAV
ncbi:MAG: hypothetical protein LBU26_04865 [Synergistaceae bacterium]|nr:hypothetical protein [Synergistaceae bacterium]